VTRPEELRGEAADRFGVWRELGLSEASAMAQVRADGLLPAGDPVDQLTEVFREMGLSESAARVAAVGRDGSEFTVRRQARAAGGAPSSDARRAERRQTLAQLDDLSRQITEFREALIRATDADLAGPPAPRQQPAAGAKRVTVNPRGSAAPVTRTVNG
jgi:hypothetical protein